MFLDYDYFCGANIVVEMNGKSVLEAAGISIRLQDSKMPIYGYSSRHFDAVAQGQVLVQGTMIINYVHQDYLFRLLQVANGEISAPVEPAIINVEDARTERLITDALSGDFNNQGDLISALQGQFWDTVSPSKVLLRTNFNVSDRLDSCDIKITFGERSSGNGFLGQTNCLLADCFFTGRGTAIQINEDVIVEEYTFFARDIYSIENHITNIVTVGEEGPTIETTAE